MPFSEDIRKLLEDKLLLTKYLTSDNIDSFYNVMSQYFTKKRFSYSYFSDLLHATGEFLRFLYFSPAEIIQIIANHPAIIHANKKDLLAKYLLIAILKDENQKLIRRDILLNHPKYLLGGIHLLYARYNYLIHNGLDDSISKYHLLKMTNAEFAKTFKISSEQLKAEYPLDDITLLINDLAKWPENQQIGQKIQKYKSQGEIKYA